MCVQQIVITIDVQRDIKRMRSLRNKMAVTFKSRVPMIPHVRWPTRRGLVCITTTTCLQRRASTLRQQESPHHQIAHSTRSRHLDKMRRTIMKFRMVAPPAMMAFRQRCWSTLKVQSLRLCMNSSWRYGRLEGYQLKGDTTSSSRYTKGRGHEVW